MIQLTLEDSGSPQATNLDYNVNDETCEVIVFNDSVHVKGGYRKIFSLDPYYRYYRGVDRYGKLYGWI